MLPRVTRSRARAQKLPARAKPAAQTSEPQERRPITTSFVAINTRRQAASAPEVDTSPDEHPIFTPPTPPPLPPSLPPYQAPRTPKFAATPGFSSPSERSSGSARHLAATSGKRKRDRKEKPGAFDPNLPSVANRQARQGQASPSGSGGRSAVRKGKRPALRGSQVPTPRFPSRSEERELGEQIEAMAAELREVVDVLEETKRLENELETKVSLLKADKKAADAKTAWLAAEGEALSARLRAIGNEQAWTEDRLQQTQSNRQLNTERQEMLMNHIGDFEVVQALGEAMNHSLVGDSSN
ncbi:hypothetical protein AJ79_01585 [Helicocarpus griseus UAMH5409]|uniref:Uncharacterized protein n=1 Tax=Helicocarpus griseus UAMH5409 TaxID=1447875 RepID=A0A2B7Y754_9EURO|nr:hypothetical protein AJ79_01585 [Helicocarpus griseus UAMH5409]